MQQFGVSPELFLLLINSSSVLLGRRLISLRHDAYQNTVLAAANRAEVLHGLCLQLTRPVKRHPARPGFISSPRCVLRSGPAASSPPPAVPASRLPSIETPTRGPSALPLRCPLSRGVKLTDACTILLPLLGFFKIKVTMFSHEDV